MINFVCTDPLCPIRGTSSATCYRCGMNTVQNEPPNWRERAERAEAERDAESKTANYLTEQILLMTIECNALRALLAETVADRDEMKWVFGMDLLARIDAALREGK